MEYKRYRIEKENGRYLVWRRPSPLIFFLNRLFFYAFTLFFFYVVAIVVLVDILIGDKPLIFGIYRNHGWHFMSSHASEEEAVTAIVKDKTKENEPSFTCYL